MMQEGLVNYKSTIHLVSAFLLKILSVLYRLRVCNHTSFSVVASSSTAMVNVIITNPLIQINKSIEQ